MIRCQYCQYCRQWARVYNGRGRTWSVMAAVFLEIKIK